MADGDKLNGLDDSRGGVSTNSDECSPGGSPQKMISDCSDLYDLINFHSSATTQIHEENRSRSNSSSSSSSPELKRRSRYRSSSSGHSDGPDSDSGSFARSGEHANGRPEEPEPVLPSSVSPESALESSPGERATMPSSIEALSPSDSPEHSQIESPISPEIPVNIEHCELRIEEDRVVAIEAPSHETNNLLDLRDTSDEDEELAVKEIETDVQGPGPCHERHPAEQLFREHEIFPDGCQRAGSEEKLAEEALVRGQEAITEEGTWGRTEQNGLMEHIQDLQVFESENQEIVKEDNNDSSMEVVESVRVVKIVETISRETKTTTDWENGEMAEEVVPERHMDADDNHMHVDTSSSSSCSDDSDSERYRSGKKFKQMSTKVVSESLSNVSGVTTTTTTKKTTELKVELNSTHHELENGDNRMPVTSPDLSTSMHSPSPSDSGRSSFGAGDDESPGGDAQKAHEEDEDERMHASLKLQEELENVPSLATLKSTLITTQTHKDTEKETVLTGISIKELKASFNEHKPKSEETKCKEVIDTGVDIKSLRASYGNLIQIEDLNTKSPRPKFVSPSLTQRTLSHGNLSQLDIELVNGEDDFDSAIPSTFPRAKSYSDLTRFEEERQREKEVIHTGVSVRALRASFCDLTRGNARNDSAHRLNINTGVSIRSLKSSFSGSSDSVQNHDFNENEGVKIDRNKITRNFSQVDHPLYALLDANDVSNMSDELASMCRICGKQVFHMERIKAEKGVFHKTCFRCKECSKSLSVDTYCSHEGVLYCRPHFRQLFQPKAKFEEERISIPRRRHEMIIKENVPAELPPDVIRSADKPDYGLNEIPSLKNIKSRFEETENENGYDASLESVHVRRSESIVSKMAKFQGLENPENGHNHEDSSSSSDEENGDDNPEVSRESKKKEKPLQIEVENKALEEEVVFSGMSELKSQWETGPVPTKEERARERQEELAKLRLRICHGKGSLKAKYESACEESAKSPTRQESAVDLNGDLPRASSIKEKFEKGDVLNDDEFEKVEKIQREKEEDLSVFKEHGTANDARSLFKQIDATVVKTAEISPTTNVKRSPSMRSREILYFQQSPTVTDGEIIKASDKINDDVMAPVDLTSKFKFFENYQDIQGTPERKRFTMTPPREPVKEDSPETEIIRDPTIVRCCDKDEEVIVTDTARKMLNKFRELEIQAEREEIPAGLKPLKRITPPREYTKDTQSPEPELPRDPNIVRACDKIEDDFLIEAHKAKSLREKFEHWEDLENDVEKENRKNAEDDLQQPTPETAKNLKAKFEALQEESDRPLEKPKSRINRFIDFGDGTNGELCDICGKRVYTMEKLEVNGHKVHKTCFRCSHCGAILRMDNYTTSEGVLYCTPHFKQLFIARGNYDEGFGREQHKERWNKNSRSSTPNSGGNEMQYANGDYSDE